MTRRRVTLWLVNALVASLLVVVGAWRFWPEPCGQADVSVAAGEVTRPFPAPTPDKRLGKLLVSMMGWQLGVPTATVGYDYGRFIDFAGLPGMLGVWRKGDPVFAAIDPATGDPRWGIRQGKARHTWDASAERFVLLAAEKEKQPEVSSFDMVSGDRVWCARLHSEALSGTDPVSTHVLTNNDVLVLAGEVGDQRLTALKGKDGDVRWARDLHGIDRGDFLSGPFDGVVTLGGRPSHELDEPAAKDARVLAGVDDRTGEVRWTHKTAKGQTVNVAGDVDGQVALWQRRQGADSLAMLDQVTGEQQWQRRIRAGSLDVAVRGGVVLVRRPKVLRAFAIGTGKPVWRLPLRQQPQLFPYGFRLGEQPMLDRNRILLGATDALIAVDLRNGHKLRLPLPTDGIKTTYWPYRVVATDDLIAVATNIGAAVLTRTR